MLSEANVALGMETQHVPGSQLIDGYQESASGGHVASAPVKVQGSTFRFAFLYRTRAGHTHGSASVSSPDWPLISVPSAADGGLSPRGLNPHQTAGMAHLR